MATGRLDPTGTSAAAVTFLFTDVVGSTRLWEEDSEAMQEALRRHDELVAVGVAAHRGDLVRARGEGDSHFAVFASAPDAAAAALDIQRSLTEQRWPTPWGLRVRMALHTGEAEWRAGDYYGADVNRCARLRSMASGGQILLSGSAATVVGSALSGGSLRDLGWHQLRDVGRPEHVFQLCHPSLPDAFPPLQSLPTRRHNLPRPTSSFVGRDVEMVAVEKYLRQASILTLTGVGGGGKTRLALEVARRLTHTYRDGVWLVELASLSDGALIPATVSAALGIEAQGTRPMSETLVEYLRERELLLVLDNCEHLVAAAACFVHGVLERAPGATVLATSREPLGVPGETVWHVPPMEAPEGDVSSPREVEAYEAVRLFVDRAIETRGEFALCSENALAVARICSRLDGIPLAIELAAARVRLLSPKQIADRLDRRFEILVNPKRPSPPRHRTLRAAIEWSYDALLPAERTLFVRLSAFAGGFSLEAAEQVCTDASLSPERVLDLLGSLVDKSLVVSADQSGVVRYWLLETLRQFGQERLDASGDRPSVVARHFHWCLALATSWSVGLASERFRSGQTVPQQWQVFQQIDAEYDNMRAAVLRSLDDKRAEDGLRLVTALAYYCICRDHLEEWADLMESALSLEGNVSSAVRVQALIAAGTSIHDPIKAESWATQALALATDMNDQVSIAESLDNVGWWARYGGDLDAAARQFEASLAAWRRSPIKGGVAHGVNCTLGSLADVGYASGDHEQARELYEQALSLSRSWGDSEYEAGTVGVLASIARVCGEMEAARALYRESLIVATRCGSRRMIAEANLGLGRVALAEGDLGRASRLVTEALADRLAAGATQYVGRCLAALGEIAVAEGRLETGARLLGAAAHFSDGLDPMLVSPVDRRAFEAAVDQARLALGQESFETAWADGGTVVALDLLNDVLDHL